MQERRSVVHRLDDLEVVRLEQADQAVPEEGEVFGEDDTHGSTITTSVGPPGGLSTASVPSNADSRRSMPRRPVPRPGSAPPTPSSRIDIVNRSSDWRSTIHACLACAC